MKLDINIFGYIIIGFVIAFVMKIYFIVRYSNDNKDSLSILESIESERLSVESIIISKL